MEEILKKRISRRDFLKTCIALTTAGLVSLAGLNVFKKSEDKEINYGHGSYGGRHN